jgi:hypothetical protein
MLYPVAYFFLKESSAKYTVFKNLFHQLCETSVLFSKAPVLTGKIPVCAVK